MAQKSQVILKDAPGLKTQPSMLGIPAGSLLEAQNADTLRPGIYQCRRGFAKLIGTPDIKKFWQYRKTLWLHTGPGNTVPNSIYFYDGTLHGGAAYEPPDSSTRIQALEAVENCYVTTKTGPQVFHALANLSNAAGMQQGLDCSPTLAGTGAGWFQPDGQVGYKIVFLRIDVNGNEIAGPASYQDIVTNPAPVDVAFIFAAGTVTVTQTGHGYTTGDTIDISSVSDAAYEAGPHTITVTGANTYTYTVAGAPASPGTGKASKRFNVSLSVTLMTDDLDAGDYVEIYRTRASASDDTPPGDEHYLIIRRAVTGTEINNRNFTYVDTTEETSLGAKLESNPSVNGPSQAPARPPWARYVGWWQGHAWWAHTRQQHNRTIQLLDVAGLVDATSSITLVGDIANETYTFDTAENIGAKRFQRFTGEPTLAANIRKTMRSFVHVLNRASTYWEAHYISGALDNPGKVLIRRRVFNVAAFSITANNATTGGKFSPEIPTAGTTVSSDDDYRQNGLYNSRAGRPEAVPFANGAKVGSDLDAILGIVATSSALLVFTEGGTYMVTGQTDGGAGKSFNIDELDLNMRLLVPETLVALDDHAFGLFNQGICRISTSGSAIMSEGHIGERINRISKFTNIATLAHAVSYESDHKYLFCAPAASGDTTCKQIWVYNYLQNDWVGPWDRFTVTGTVLNRGDDLLYLGRSDAPEAGPPINIVQERKNFTADDFRDENYTIPVTAKALTTAEHPWSGSVSLVTVDWATSFDPPVVGYQFTQGGASARICKVTALGGISYNLTLDKDINASITVFGNAVVYRPIDWLIRYPLDGGNASALKQGNEAHAYFENPHPIIIEFGFQSDMISAIDWNIPYLNDPPGSAGASDPFREKIPLDHQRHRVLHLSLRHRNAGEGVALLQVAEDVRTISTVTRR